jgi:threonyl-tRNA synthetase
MNNTPYEESNLYKIRHTTAHVLAMAVLEWDPDAKLAIGPPIENGFYYDFQLSKALTEKDLSVLEKSMWKIINKNFPVVRKTLKKSEAEKQYRKDQQPYKLELAENLEDTELSFYGIDTFWDLCKGPHVKSTNEIKAFKLLSTAGAYWRGDEHQPMLTRIYGTAFESEKQLKEYLEQLSEAKRRDHKILGPKLGLFTFSELVGSGLPLWKPKGTVLRNVLDDAVWELRKEKGYQKVEIPHITKKDLYITSGHWEKFKDELFLVKTREGHEFAMKPMNCPHHTQIFASEQRSYRDMPQRYSNTTMVYRDEQSGELAGLSRVRGFTQDDAHIFCRPSQIEKEVKDTWDIVDAFYKKFGFKLEVRLSLSDPKEPEKYLGKPEQWQQAEQTLRSIARSRKVAVIEQEGEAAFYGPKVDFMAKDSIGRQWQVATIQLDFNMPERFDLYCINEQGNKERAIMIHVAVMGSLERFISVLIEHYAGDFPFWVAPTQIKILSVSEKAAAFSKEVFDDITKQFRAELDITEETLGKKIRTAELEKVPIIVVIGEKELAEKKVTLRIRATQEQKTIDIKKLVSYLTDLSLLS